MTAFDFIVHSDPSTLLFVGVIVIVSLAFTWFVVAVLD